MGAIERLLWSLVASLNCDQPDDVKSETAALRRPAASNKRIELLEQLKGLIGIVTPYKSQVRAIKDQLYRLLRNQFGADCPQEYIEVNTVDGYQGREKDIIIFSCVRSND